MKAMFGKLVVPALLVATVALAAVFGKGAYDKFQSHQTAVVKSEPTKVEAAAQPPKTEEKVWVQVPAGSAELHKK